MAYWLMKSEPGSWSWDDQVKEGVAEWDGVRNYQAANNMKAMKTGDKVFFYHSVKEKQVVGICEVVKEYYPDPSDASGRFGMVDIKALQALRPAGHPGRDQGRAGARSELALVRHTRLSVMPVAASPNGSRFARWARPRPRRGGASMPGRRRSPKAQAKRLSPWARAPMPGEILVLRQDGRLLGYLNVCPHAELAARLGAGPVPQLRTVGTCSATPTARSFVSRTASAWPAPAAARG